MALKTQSFEVRGFLAIVCLVTLTFAFICLVLWEIRWIVDGIQNFETYEKHICLIKTRLENMYINEANNSPSFLDWESQILNRNIRILCIDIVTSRFEESIQVIKSRQVFLEKAAIIFALFIIFIVYFFFGWPDFDAKDSGELFKYLPYLFFVVSIIQPFLFLAGQSRIESYQLSLSFLKNLKQIEEAVETVNEPVDM